MHKGRTNRKGSRDFINGVIGLGDTSERRLECVHTRDSEGAVCNRLCLCEEGSSSIVCAYWSDRRIRGGTTVETRTPLPVLQEITAASVQGKIEE